MVAYEMRIGDCSDVCSSDLLLWPSSFIGSVDVYKSSEARLDEGGVGGVIINHTRKPFDLKPWSSNIQAEGTYADVTDKIEPSVSGLISWKDPSERIGFLVGATYQESTNLSLSASGHYWTWRPEERCGGKAWGRKGRYR